MPGPFDAGVVTLADVHDDSPGRPLVIYRPADEAFTDEMRAVGVNSAGRPTCHRRRAIKRTPTPARASRPPK
jgi:hypothetical protein